MKIRCGNCGTVYNIKDSIITDKPRKVRCSKCNHIFTVKRTSETQEGKITVKLKDQAATFGAIPTSKSPSTPPIEESSDPSQPSGGIDKSKSLFLDEVPSSADPYAQYHPDLKSPQSQTPEGTGSTKSPIAPEKPTSDPMAQSTTAPAQGQKWNVKVEGEVYEDLDIITVKKWIREGRFQPMDEVMSENGEWVIACDIPLLMKYFRLKESIDASKGVKTPSRDEVDVMYCTTHPQEIAQWKCANCGKKFCGQCVKYQTFGTHKVAVCDKCGDRCVELKPPRMIKPFWTQIPQMLAFPFVKGGAIMTIIGFIVSLLPYIGLIIYPYSFRILNSSARGKDRMPDWPDFSDIWEDILLPFFQFTLGSLFVLIPFLGYTYWKYGSLFAFIALLAPQIAILIDPVLLILFVLGLLYLPMVLIIVAVFKRLIPALNPVTVFRLIWAIKKEYFIAILLCLLVFVIAVILIISLHDLPFGLGNLGNWFFIIVVMRILGLMVYQVEDKLGWD